MPASAGSPPTTRLPILSTGGERFVVVLSLLVLGAAVTLLPLKWAVIAVVTFAALMFSVASPIWAIAVAFAVIPLEVFVVDLGPVGLAPVQITVLLAVALMVFEALAAGRIDVPRTPLDAWIFLWLAAGVFGAIEAYDPSATIKKAGMAVVFVLFFYLVAAKVRRIETVTTLMKVFVASSAAVGAYGVWLSVRYLASGVGAGDAIIVGSEGLAVPRAGSTLGQPTVLAGLMVLALPIAAVLVMETKGAVRAAAVAAAGAIVLSLGFTFTRGAWLGGVAGLAVLGLDKRTRWIPLVMLLLVAVLAPEVVYERAVSSTDVGRKEISHRFDYWEGALLVAEKRPMFGAGIDNFRHNYARLPVPETALRGVGHPHNLVLDLLADTGLVGLLSFGGLMAGVLTLLLRRRSSDPDAPRRLWRLAIAASLIGTLVHQTTDSLLLEPTWNSTTWMMMALAVVMGLGWAKSAPGPETDTEPAP